MGRDRRSLTFIDESRHGGRSQYFPSFTGPGSRSSSAFRRRAAYFPDSAAADDLHATILHVLGLDHSRVSFYNIAIERRLTDVHGHVIEEFLA